MQQLSSVQVSRLRQELRRRTSQREVPEPLIRRLALEVEVLMASGKPFEEALLMTLQRHSPGGRTRPRYDGIALRGTGRRPGQRHLVSAQWPAWMRGSVVAFATVMICMMWAGRLFAISPAVFKDVWMVELGAAVCAYGARRLFRMRAR